MNIICANNVSKLTCDFDEHTIILLVHVPLTSFAVELIFSLFTTLLNARCTFEKKTLNNVDKPAHNVGTYRTVKQRKR